MKDSEKKDLIVEWIRTYASTSNLNALIIGISGGIDSSVTSALCAATGITTYVVSLPIHQQKDQLSRAHNHAIWLKSMYNNVVYVEKDLTSVFSTFSSLFEDITTDLSLANARSRLRMVSLYQIAQTKNGLVVGTGNKVEDFGVGFFTKYGDGGVDISPIADLMKSEVKSLAKHLGITEDIINAPPTDGLWDDNRTDEDQMGITYNELEWAMTHNKEEALSHEKSRVMNIYLSLHERNNHKMQPIPVCKVSGK